MVMVPEGFLLTELEEKTAETLPGFIRQTVKMDELESFIRYVTEFQEGEGSRIFATKTETGASFLAVLDYHTADANRCMHRVEYSCPFSREWDVWTKGNKVAMTQEQFCEFVDANIVDITAPESAALLELLMNFEAKSSVAFQSDLVRQSGGKVLKYQEVIEGGRTGASGTIKVPEELLLSIPVFQGGGRYLVKARLLYRVNSGSLKLSYELHRPHESVQSAIEETVNTVAEQTKIKPLIGKPINLPSY